MAEYSIWGDGPPSVETDGPFDDGAAIKTATAFYSTATAWYCTGGGLRVPAASGMSGTVTIGLRIAPYQSLVDLSAAPVRSAVGVIQDGWTRVEWESFPVPAQSVMWISPEDLGNDYLFATLPTADPIQSVDGVDLYLAEQGIQPRSAYRVGAGATTASPSWYGAEVYVSDQPPLEAGAFSVGGVPIARALLGRRELAGVRLGETQFYGGDA